MTERLICLVSGGTGGHVYPALALAQVLHARGHHVIMITDSRGRVFQESEAISQVIKLPIYRGTGAAKAVILPTTMAYSLAKSTVMLQHYAPDAVVGFGGYPSVPAMVAAQLMRKPTVVHEQNAVMGRANRLAARRADLIATAFKDVKFLPANKETTLTGNPVRSSILAVRGKDYKLPTETEKFNILIIGGSQGAEIFTKVVPEVMSRLPYNHKKKLYVHQQCRPEQYDETVEAYRKGEITADVKPFFDDIDRRLQSAHLVICRAGASTVAELTTAGRPAIFCSLPSRD